jgi:hypothetical protein
MYDRLGRRAAERGAAAGHDRADRREPTHAQLVDAAMVAIAAPDFYNVSLVNFVTPWTNVEQTVFADLNDYTATVIGMIRDGIPFDQVLTADLVYVAAPGLVTTPYEHTSNTHYVEIQQNGLDLSNPAQLVGVRQSTLPGAQIGAADAAGVVTTRAAAEAFFSAGTNRRMWRFTTRNYLCRDMESLKDTSRPTDRIRQDVNRSPGGDSEIFHTQCVGCHSGMDAVAGAYAYFEWDATQMRMVHTPGQVQGKYAINTGVFPGGHITTDNSWINLWRQGPGRRAGLERGRARQRARAEAARRRGGAQPRVRGVPGAEGVPARLLPTAARRRRTPRRSRRSRTTSRRTSATTCARCSPTWRSIARRASSHAASRSRRDPCDVRRAARRAHVRVRRLRRRLERPELGRGGQRLPRPLRASRRCRRVPGDRLSARAPVLRVVPRGQRPGSPHFAQLDPRPPIRRSRARAR